VTLADILSWLNRHAQAGAALRLDSRQVQAGDVFFACQGYGGDGLQHVADAVEKGAVAVVAHGEPDSAALAGTPVLIVPALREQMGEVAHQWYGAPSEAISVVAITGTNGKTSCTQWVAAALNAESIACGVIGTLGSYLPGSSMADSGLTTPDVLTMHSTLAAMRDAGAVVVALEASSIGIEQGRLDGVRIDIAGFTNLTHDHLDYHLTLERYRDAKSALFTWSGLRSAVINMDDATGQRLIEQAVAEHVVSYSMISSAAHVHAQDLHAGAYGLVFGLGTRQGTVQLLTRLVGEHNVANLLLVAGVLQELGWDLSRIGRVLTGLSPVEGRLQWVEPVAGTAQASVLPMVVVDYAHTPDALERALIALRGIAAARSGRLLCVMGCGGNRDRAKRPVMGDIACRLADEVIVTSDNPRDEDPAAIALEVLQGMSSKPVVELDRAKAILRMIWGAQPADVILLAGKGHETYQEISGARTPFDDREWSRFALTWRQGATMSTDTRRIGPGQLFLALKGPVFDGADYLDQAAEQGALAAVVNARRPESVLPQIALGDTGQALLRIAAVWRSLFTPALIGVTGSNGKTTTKEMIACILRAWLGDEASMSTQGNLNNDIGVPLTLLRMTQAHRAAVIELGMNHPGEIAVLADIARPSVALVNNAQREHQEFLHTVEAVARENGTVLQYLPASGVAVFPGDDTYTALWRELAEDRPVMCFGFDSTLDVYAEQIHVEPSSTSCRIQTPQGSIAVTVHAHGAHNLRNALAAAACALAAGAPLQAIAQGLEAFRPVAGRMQPRVLNDGFQLIDDSYNANPDSVRAAIDVLAALHGKTILVLGAMGEIGADSQAAHAEVGAYARERDVDVVLTFGADAAYAAQAFGEDGQSFDDVDALMLALDAQRPAHILVKGSRSARMERVVRALEAQHPDKNQEEGNDHVA
jgi:murE/murF fusion protein